MASSLANKWVLITGASSGFGAAAALAFGAEGSKLLLGARRVEKLKEVAAQATKRGASEVHIHQLDVSKTDNVAGFVNWVRERISGATGTTSKDESSGSGSGPK